MPKFGQTSETRLTTCHRDIQTIMREVVKDFDIMIVEGQRTAERQHEHWQKGRQLIQLPNVMDTKDPNNWEIVDKAKVVTYKDGFVKKSIHQSEPKSKAVDVVPWPTTWSDQDKLDELRAKVKDVQERLLSEGRIENKLENGYDLWDGFDKPHWQLENA